MKQKLKPDQNWLYNQIVNNLASVFTKCFTKEACENAYED